MYPIYLSTLYGRYYYTGVSRKKWTNGKGVTDRVNVNNFCSMSFSPLFTRHPVSVNTSEATSYILCC